MKTKSILQEIESLPPDAQKEVADFVASLKARYEAERSRRKKKRTRVADEPFIGMWRGRENMRDGTAWVRQLRRREWERDS